MFVGFDEEDGEPLFDTRDAAFDRAKMLIAWRNEPTAQIMVYKKWVPRRLRWLANRLTHPRLAWIAWTEYNENNT